MSRETDDNAQLKLFFGVTLGIVALGAAWGYFSNRPTAEPATDSTGVDDGKSAPRLEIQSGPAPSTQPPPQAEKAPQSQITAMTPTSYWVGETNANLRSSAELDSQNVLTQLPYGTLFTASAQTVYVSSKGPVILYRGSAETPQGTLYGWVSKRVLLNSRPSVFPGSTPGDSAEAAVDAAAGAATDAADESVSHPFASTDSWVEKYRRYSLDDGYYIQIGAWLPGLSQSVFEDEVNCGLKNTTARLNIVTDRELERGPGKPRPRLGLYANFGPYPLSDEASAKAATEYLKQACSDAQLIKQER
jgi:hypothetical protein